MIITRTSCHFLTMATMNKHRHYSNKDVQLTVPSGFARRRTEILGGLVFLTFVYGLTYYILRDSSSFLKPDEKFCVNHEEPCSRPDLVAFQAAAQIMQLFMGVTGFLAWHVTKRAHTAIPNTPHGRLFGYIAEADQLNAGIFVFQTWDFFASLMIPEHASPVFLFHHVVAAMTAYFSLEHAYVHHYAIFFGGCSEISSIFLVICDFDVYFPAKQQGSAVWAAIVAFCQVAFTLTFLYYRGVGWWTVSYNLWSDALAVLNDSSSSNKKGNSESSSSSSSPLPTGKRWFLYVFLAADVILGSLQLYWIFFGIVPKIAEIVTAS